MSLTGCDLGLVDPPVEVTGVAIEMSIVADADARTIMGTVEIDPGTDSDGARMPSDKRLWIDGVAVQPAFKRSGLSYGFSRPLPVPPGVLNVRPPAFADVPASPDSILAPVLAAGAPDTLLVTAGGSIALHVHGAADPQHPAGEAPGLTVYRTSAQWTATFVPDSASSAAGASPVTIDVRGSLGPRVEIPAVLLGPEFSGGRLFFQARAVTDLRSDDGLYYISIVRTALEMAETVVRSD